MKKDSLIFLEHILENIKSINSFLSNSSKSKFLEDELLQSAVIRKIEIIGEAVKNLPIDFIRKYTNVSWRGIAGMRDKLIHHYFGVDLDTIWDTVKKDIPILKKQVEDILEKERN